MQTNSAGSQNGYLALTGRQQVTKDTNNQAVNQSEREQFPKLFTLLDSVPYLAFSEVGRRNVCKRFHITEQTLEQCLRAYVRPGDHETEKAYRDADLERVMTATPEPLVNKKAVAPSKRAKKPPTTATEGQALHG